MVAHGLLGDQLHGDENNTIVYCIKVTVFEVLIHIYTTMFVAVLSKM